MKKILFIFLIAVCLLAPVSVLAAGTTLAPEFNPLCWEADACGQTRASIGGVDYAKLTGAQKKYYIEQGWIQNEEPCNKAGWGKCLPAYKTTTEMAFGGKQEFANIGEFIKVNYNYLLAIISILAVVVIIISGVQWTVSAGSAEVITSAKKRIGGALIGLFIAYMSFAILQTINPALVNLRLPQIWLIRPGNVAPEWCKDVPKDVGKFAIAAKADDKVKKEDYLKADFTKNIDVKDMKCGDQYFVKDANGEVCRGFTCEKKNLCLPIKNSAGSVSPGYQCTEGELILHLTMNSIEEQFMQSFNIICAGMLEDKQHWMQESGSAGSTVWAVCRHPEKLTLKIGNYEQWGDSGETFKLNKVINKSGWAEYYLQFGGFATAGGAWPESHWNCGEGYELVGFILKVELGKKCNVLYDVNLFIGYDYSKKQAVFGAWNIGVGDVCIQHYFPLSLITKEGVYLDVGITGDKLKSAADSSTALIHKHGAPIQGSDNCTDLSNF